MPGVMWRALSETWAEGGELYLEIERIETKELEIVPRDGRPIGRYTGELCPWRWRTHTDPRIRQ